MKNVVTLVLGGGQGTRLYPLTKYRSKPAVPVAGKYRLIDIPLSNCINSGLNRCYVLTQFNSVSLHRHIRSTYTFDPFDGGFVEVLAAQQTIDNADWYQGTADAVRQNLRYVEQPGIEYVLILSGDQLYRMNFQDMILTHMQAAADVTIAAVPVHSRAASSLGIMRCGRQPAGWSASSRSRKPKQELSLVRTDPAWIDARGIPSGGRDCLANMGIYLFNRDTLIDVLRKTDYRDFGKEVFPASIRARHVQVHLFDGYWEDIGTIKSFYEANLALAKPDAPVRSGVGRVADLLARPVLAPHANRRRHGPRQPGGRRLDDRGGRRDREQRDRPALPHRPQRHDPQFDRDGQRFLRDAGVVAVCRANGDPPLGVGEGSHIEGAIIDKNCRIGRNVRIVNERGLEHTEETPYGMIRDGIVVMAKNTAVPDGWKMLDAERFAAET